MPTEGPNLAAQKTFFRIDLKWFLLLIDAQEVHIRAEQCLSFGARGFSINWEIERRSHRADRFRIPLIAHCGLGELA